MVLNKAYKELVLIRKELQKITKILESISEYATVMKVFYMQSHINDLDDKRATFQEVLRACHQYLKEC